ncbi:unnamed protein product [Cunninghamella blakesleeana]
MENSESLVRFENQVAGHDRILRFSSNNLMIIKPCKQRERLFYEQSQNHEDFLNWIPECYGSLRESTESEIQLMDEEQDVATLPINSLTVSNQVDQNENLCLENILYGFTRPCILDLKLGYQLYEDSADEKKREKMIKNALGTTIEYYGIRISGMKVFNSVTRKYTQYFKKYGRERNKDNFIDGLFRFFYPCHFNNDNDNESKDNSNDDDDPSDDSEDYSNYYSTSIIDHTELDKMIKKPLAKNKIEWIIEHYTDTLMDILDFVQEHPELQLIGSSILMVYEGDAAAAQQVWKKMLDEDREQENVNQITRLNSMDNNNNINNNGDEDEDDTNQLDPKLCDIRLIDFGKSQWSSQRSVQDPKLVKALENIIHFLNQVLENGPSPTSA